MLITTALGTPAVTQVLLRVVCSRAAAWTRTYATATDSLVKEVDNDADFDKEIKALAQNGALGVVDFTAKWCGPCKAIAPLYEQLSKQYPQARFLKVDIDNEQLQRTVMDHGITGVPTFAFYKGARHMESFTGARVDLLKATVEKLSK